MTDYALSIHAQTAIAERSIPIEWLERVLSKPEKTDADKFDTTLGHALGRIPEHGNRVLRVIYNHSTQPITIVTAYFDRTMRNTL